MVMKFSHRVLAGSLALAGLLAPPAWAQDGAAGDSALPLNKVVMFNSGVGFFEHRGEVEGDAKVELRFRVEDINDLLKSMVLEDRGGGKISTVSYGSRDPITKTLKTFPIDLTNNPTLGTILDQVRGETVQIDAPAVLKGILVGVEKRKREVGKNGETVEAEFLNLLTDSGLRSVPLDSIGQIKLLDEKLDAEFRSALRVLAGAHNTDKKTVTLNLLGQGKRPVRVGYIQETPVWKTSYRLVLDDKQKPFLQGWAIVENTTEGDWNNVTLTLVSGRPISYSMDLYEPLYVQRPVEQLNLFASLRPQSYGQDMSNVEERFRKLAQNPGAANQAVPRQMASKAQRYGIAGGMGGGVAGESARDAAAPAAPALAANENYDAVALAATPSAQAAEVGELFQYVIDTPVTLQRQKSAMLPIVNASVEGQKVSIYNQAVQAKHPLNGLKLVNSTDLHLMQGPLTVFDGGTYAGDAKIEDLAPHGERLISYALDLKTEVAPEMKSSPEQLTSVKVVKGALETTRKLSRTRSFAVKNSDTKIKTVLIEVPRDPNWKLVTPEKPTEKTRDVYRFAVEAEPGKPARLEVVEENVIHQQLQLTNLDQNVISFYLSQESVSANVKAALQEIIKRKMALEKLVTSRQQLEQEIAAITQEQERIRQNMGQLDRNTDLYKRYVQKFGTQEDTVEKLRTTIQTLTASETQQRRALDEYLVNLSV